MNPDTNHFSDNAESGDSLRVLERACDAALFGDAPSVEEVLDARARGFDLADETESFELIAAQLECEHYRANPSIAPSVPPALRARLRQMAESLDAPKPLPISRAVKPSARSRTALRDWLVAAACIAFGAVSTFVFVQAGAKPAQELPTDPTRFVSMYPTAVRWPWQPTNDSHVVGNVRGEALFDPRTSKGLLVIEGLAPNDPAVEQYQLWIFDATRDERYPVDGGVFDVPACGQASVPIEAKLRVDKPVLFAVTVEKPGGVVVSDRRIALLAKP
ncbi:MAG: hypothetical protein RLY21_1331 [Planctomycetota bacterium]